MCLVLATVVAFYACHRGSTPQPETPASESTEVTGVNGISGVSGDSTASVISAPSGACGNKLTVQHDTAEETNLRIFARKQRTVYSPQSMVGVWFRGGEYEQYMADSSGLRWVSKDDIRREEAQRFRWTMDSNLLTLKYTMALGGLMIRQYVVTFLDDEMLVYGDAYGGSFMWDKVSDTSALQR